MPQVVWPSNATCTIRVSQSWQWLSSPALPQEHVDYGIITMSVRPAVLGSFLRFSPDAKRLVMGFQYGFHIPHLRLVLPYMYHIA